MTNENKAVLRGIMHDLKGGKRFGKDCFWNYYDNKPMRFPYFDCVLSMSENGKYIRYSHFGSSAIKANTKELEWLISVIFQTSPAEFLKEYISSDYSKIPA